MRSRSLTWIAVVGLVLILSGVAWIAAWDYTLRDAPDWIRYELRPPMPARSTVFFGFLLTVSTAGIHLYRFVSRQVRRVASWSRGAIARDFGVILRKLTCFSIQRDKPRTGNRDLLSRDLVLRNYLRLAAVFRVFTRFRKIGIKLFDARVLITMSELSAHAVVAGLLLVIRFECSLLPILIPVLVHV
jgi:hypothetical protein